MTLDYDKLLYIDFEAQSELDIRKVGARVYAEHPSTRILCAAWALGDEPVQLWIPVRDDPRIAIPDEWLDRAADRPDDIWVAHNKDTERHLLWYKLGLSIGNWIDTATLASQAGLPRALDEVASALGLPPTGDTGPMLQLARPRKPTRDNPDRFWTSATRPDLFAQLYDYCKQDVETARRILKSLPYSGIVSYKERLLEFLTDKMNDRGVQVDTIGIELAKGVVEAHSEELKAEFQTILPGINPKSATKRAEALGLQSTNKQAVRDALKDYQAAQAKGWSWLYDRKRALEIIKTLNTAATGKLEAFSDRTTGQGKLHGAMTYAGAGRTWRWSSMGVQLHNLIRGLGSGSVDWPAVDTDDRATEIAFGALHNDILPALYDNPIRAIASMMKGFLVGPFLMGDFSQIEPRVLAMLANQTSLTEAFRAKTDPYKALASRVYGVPVGSVTSDQRFMGKQGVLGCGYGLGPDGFINMLKTIYDVNVSHDEAKRVVAAYRSMNHDIVDYWYALDRLAKTCVLEQWQEFHTSPACPGIGVAIYKSWLVIKLPSGRKLWYFEPSLVPDERGMELHYWGRNPKYGGKWMRVKTYGGKLTENITQATARDIMAEAMMHLEDAGYPVLMTVHDEIVCHACYDMDPDRDVMSIDKFEQVMLRPPYWMPNIPLAVDVQLTERYQK